MYYSEKELINKALEYVPENSVNKFVYITRDGQVFNDNALGYVKSYVHGNIDNIVYTFNGKDLLVFDWRKKIPVKEKPKGEKPEVKTVKKPVQKQDDKTF